LIFTDQIVTYTLDFARGSRVLKYFVNRTIEIYPPIELSTKEAEIPLLKKSSGLFIGMATRIAAEKGIDIMLKILPDLKQDFPDIKLVIAGEVNSIGEEKYLNQLKPDLGKLKKDVILLGKINSDQITTFYKKIDLLVVASVNSTEAFGLVQIEAMINGCPVVATDLPGVRIPIRLTGMGEIAKVADKEDLYLKIKTVLNNRQSYKKNKSTILRIFDLNETIEKYMKTYMKT
jgi:glycosyltransferase involved in cell wall biosynthesis